MNTRSLSLYGTVAVISLAAGGALALWTAGLDNDAPTHKPAITDATPLPGRSADRPARDNTSTPADLRLNKAVGLNDDDTKTGDAEDEQKSLDVVAEQARDAALRKFDWAMAEQPAALDLKLPESAAGESGQDTEFAGADTPGRAEPQPVAAFDLEPQPEATPQVESYSLFNPEYGLRGFMAQSWVSQRFGIQGGLGLNDDRVIRTESDFRDDIAVGMGVILAF